MAGAFEIFKAVALIMTDLDSLERIIREIIADYAKQNCVYLELRSTPKALLIDRLTGTKGSMKDYIDRILKAIKEGEAEEGKNIRVRYIASVNRGASIEQAREIIDLAIQYKKDNEPYLVGVELSGDPRVGKFSDFKDIFIRAKEEGDLKVSLHCAELPEQAKETPEMLDFKPNRLGHCIYMVTIGL